MDADGRVEVGVRRRHDRGHRPSRRQPRHVDPVGIVVIRGHHPARDAGDERGLSLIPPLVSGLEPVPALRGVGGGGLRGIDDEEPIRFRQEVHAGAGGEIVGVLRATVEHHDERQGLPSIPTGDV
jgi:hypothetical protein